MNYANILRGAAVLAALAVASTAGCGSVTTTTTSSSSSSGGGICGGYDDQAGHPVTVHFKNQTGQAIYLPSQCNKLDYTIAPSTGPDGRAYVYDLSCDQTCEQLQTEPGIACEIACMPVAHKIESGATYDVVWDGTALQLDVAMPSSCWYQGKGFGSCSRIVTPDSGKYAITATAFDGCGTSCACDAMGNCNEMASGLMANAAPVTFDVPTANEVDVVFETCAFGCPGN